MTLTIADGLAVTLHYRLKLSDGTTVSDTFPDEPVVFVHGSGLLVPGLERELLGKSAGATCTVVLEPEDGYGERDADAVRTFQRSMFPDGSEIEPGVSFSGQSPHGSIQLWVTSVSRDEVTVTSNHPLAGERLHYEVEIVEVREATPEEAAPPDT
ncbi:MAG: peptidylprolyl isomerase [Planctomycetota bacterium]